MTNSEQDPGYQAWITGLMAGTVSAEEQAAPRVSRPAGVETTGRNVWAVSTEDGDGALTTFTLMAGPGVPGLIAAR